MPLRTDALSGPRESFDVEMTRKSYVLKIFGRTATLEIVASPEPPDISLFPRPWRILDLETAWVAWRLDL